MNTSQIYTMALMTMIIDVTCSCGDAEVERDHSMPDNSQYSS